MRTLEVSLRGRPVGLLEARGRSTRFYFSDSYIQDAGRDVLGLRLEENLRAQWTGQDELPSWFMNLLPEGSLNRLVVEEMSRDLGRSPDYVDILVRLGADLPGAVTVREIDSPTSMRTYDFADENHGAETRSEGTESTGLRFSVAGVGMKFSLLRQADKFVAPAAGMRGDWLVKLPDPMFSELPTNEFATMNLARSVGIDVPRTLLIRPDDIANVPSWLWHGEQSAFAVERFDRTTDGPIHIEDFAQVRGLPVSNRYSGNFETVASLVWRRNRGQDLREFVRRLAFNFLVGNDDAHLKNWSLIYRDGRTPSLSPAYDLVSVEAYSFAGLERGTGLRFANSRHYRDLSRGGFKRLARVLGYSGDLLTVLDETIERVSCAWDQYLEEIPSGLAVDRVDRHFRAIREQLLRD